MSRYEIKEVATGTYILVLSLPNCRSISVGSLGMVPFDRGYYMYIGSAFGPGGLNARIGRHLRYIKKHHWHIDYLAAEASIIEVWYSKQDDRHECRWAEVLEEESDLTIPVAGFGSSDCSCSSHLFYRQKKPIFTHYRNHLGSGLQKWLRTEPKKPEPL